MSDEISHAEAASYIPSSEPAPSSEHDHAAPVIKEIADKAWEAIQTSPDVDVDDFVQEQKDRAAEEKGEELSKHRREARRERFQRALEAAKDAERNPAPDKRDALERARDENDHRHEEPREES